MGEVILNVKCYLSIWMTETEVSRWLSGTHNLTLATIAKMATVLGDDIITTTQTHRPYKLPNMQNVAMMVAEDICKNSHTK